MSQCGRCQGVGFVRNLDEAFDQILQNKPAQFRQCGACNGTGVTRVSSRHKLRQLWLRLVNPSKAFVEDVYYPFDRDNKR